MGQILYLRREHCAYITLNNPDKHNALNAHNIKQFIAYLDQAEADADVRVLIIRGSGDKTFCAGAALEQLKDNSLRGDAFSTLAQKIVAFKLPSICLLNGSVYGGGVELALACDFRIGIANSKLQVPIGRLGLSYSAYGLKLYQAVLGLNTSKRILMSAEILNAEQLLHLGFYDFLFADFHQADAHCQQLSCQIAELAPLAVQAMRQTLNEIAMQDFALQKALEREQLCFNSQDKREAFNAILEKRQAKFSGR